MTDNMIRISWNSGEMEIAAGAIAFAPMAKLRKSIFPHIPSCSKSDKELLITCIAAEYRDAVNNRKTKNAENLFSRLSEFCTACGVDLPENLPQIKAIPDMNYNIDISKLAKVVALEAPAATIERCTVPIMHKVVSSCPIDRYECYMADGLGVMIDNVPCYAQKVKSNLYILNICGASAPIYQWRTISAAREGLETAARECMVKVADRIPEALERLKAFFTDMPEPLPEDQTLEEPAPEEITAAPEDQTPEEPAAPAPAPRKAKRRAAPDWVGKTMTAYPRKPKKPDWIGRKMVITIGERCARPAGA